MHLTGQVAWKDLGAGSPKDENFAWSTSTSPLKYKSYVTRFLFLINFFSMKNLYIQAFLHKKTLSENKKIYIYF
jgi:hypothetical protein